MLEVFRNIAYKFMPIPLAEVGGRRTYHVQITIVTQRLVKFLGPSLESADCRDPLPRSQERRDDLDVCIHNEHR
jgi:hypothetical protein